jgi:O-antigen ligase
LRTWSAWGAGAAIVAGAVALGAVAASSPIAVSLAAALVLIGILALTASSALTTWSMPQIYLVAALVLGGLVGLPASIHVGPYSGQAAITAGMAILGLGTILALDRRCVAGLPRPLNLLLAFAVWGLLSFTWGSPTVAATQNLLAYLTFAFTILLGYVAVRIGPNSPALIGRAMTFASLLSFGLFATNLAIGGAGSNAVIASRSFGLFGLLGVAWFAAGWRYRVPWCAALTLVGVALITLSLSRTATVAAFLIAALAHSNLRRPPGGFFRALLFTGVALILVVGAVAYIPSLHNRFFQGDVRNVAGVSINLEGRTKFWSTTWQSYTKSSIIGHGAGSADVLITKVYGAAAAHPHNDYLRLLHDLGIVGAALWVLGYAGVLYRTGRAWQGPPLGAVPLHQRLHCSACLGLLAVATAMITDNVMIYLFVMAPLGALVGSSLGLALRTNKP